MKHTSLSRRALVKTLTLGTAGAALAARAATSDGSDQLSVKDPKAVALGYVLEASQVDVKKFPGFVKGSNCENCLQLKGKEGEKFRPCAIFPGKLVAAGGWCSGWTAEM